MLPSISEKNETLRRSILTEIYILFPKNKLIANVVLILVELPRYRVNTIQTWAGTTHSFWGSHKRRPSLIVKASLAARVWNPYVSAAVWWSHLIGGCCLRGTLYERSACQPESHVYLLLQWIKPAVKIVVFYSDRWSRGGFWMNVCAWNLQLIINDWSNHTHTHPLASSPGKSECVFVPLCWFMTGVLRICIPHDWGMPMMIHNCISHLPVISDLPQYAA